VGWGKQRVHCEFWSESLLKSRDVRISLKEILGYRLWGWEMDRTGSGLCPVSSFGFCYHSVSVPLTSLGYRYMPNIRIISPYLRYLHWLWHLNVVVLFNENTCFALEVSQKQSAFDSKHTGVTGKLWNRICCSERNYCFWNMVQIYCLQKYTQFLLINILSCMRLEGKYFCCQSMQW
jgi:hypothetical protein